MNQKEMKGMNQGFLSYPEQSQSFDQCSVVHALLQRHPAMEHHVPIGWLSLTVYCPLVSFPCVVGHSR